VQAVADRLVLGGAQRVTAAGGALYGLWRSQIGRPRDEIQAMTMWPGAVRAGEAERLLLLGEADIWTRRSEVLLPTLRPTDTAPRGARATTPSAGSRRRSSTGRSSSTSAPRPGRASRAPTIRR
jgi:hypothetical protein